MSRLDLEPMVDEWNVHEWNVRARVSWASGRLMAVCWFAAGLLCGVLMTAGYVTYEQSQQPEPHWKVCGADFVEDLADGGAVLAVRAGEECP